MTRDRLIYVAPDAGTGGVGDYASTIISAVRPSFRKVLGVRGKGPGKDRLVDVVAGIRYVQELAAEEPDNTIVHADLSAGSLLPFWSLRQRVRNVLYTATVHDGPGLVWWPWAVPSVAKRRPVQHGIHYPTRKLTQLLERKVAPAHIISLTRAGQAAFGELYKRSSVHYVPHFFSPIAGSNLHMSNRPAAIGVYGQNYGGKNFEKLAVLRSNIASEVQLHVAGRDTENLTKLPGVQIWGEVNDARETEFFNSIRCVLLPYETENRYGQFIAASGAAARAWSHRTPVITTRSRNFGEEAQLGLCQVIDGGLERLAVSAGDLALNLPLLSAYQISIDAAASSRSVDAIARKHVELWASLS